jgi:hypothetical protein
MSAAFRRDLLNEIKEGPDFRGRQMARGVIGVERIKLLRPVTQHRHQIAAPQPGIEPERETLEQAVTGGAGLDGGRGIVGRHPVSHIDIDGLAVSRERPFGSPLKRTKFEGGQ